MKQTIKINAQNIDALYLEGSTQEKHYQFVEASHTFEKILKLMPESKDVLTRLIKLYIETKNLKKLEQTLKPFLKKEPQNIGGQLFWLKFLELSGDKEAARVQAKKILFLSPDNIHVIKMASENELLDYEVNENKLEGLLKQNNLPINHAIDIYFLLGNLHDRNQSWEKALGAYQKAHHLKKEISIHWDVNSHHSFINRIIHNYSNIDLSDIKFTSKSNLITPIFVLGMSRSGKTFTEEVLACDPSIKAGDEILIDSYPSMRWIAETVGLDAHQFLTNEHLKALNIEYQNLMQSIVGTSQSRYLTNTTPDNFIYVGALARAFPNAIFIWNRRNKHDTILYNYLNNYKAGHFYANDIEHIEDYFIQYERLMNFWKGLIPDRFIEISFEEIINDPLLIIDQMNSKTCMHDAINMNKTCLNEIRAKGVRYQRTQGHSEHYKELIGRLS